jgi:glycosyltransferase involved in cell wall biosynthesis
MSNLPISVALATFNGEKYLPEQLDSLAQQSQKPAELVVCDDRSTDATIAILRDFARTAPFPVRIFENPEHLYFKANFMKAASLCSAPIVAFCDQDDIWLADKIEALSEAFKSDCLAVSHDLSVFYNDNRPPIPSYFDHLARNGIPFAINVKGCSLAFRREFIEIFGWPSREAIWAHDIWISLISTMMGKRKYLHRPLIRHRIHQNNVDGWIMQDQSQSQRLLRGLRLPPFTTKSDFDVLLSLCTLRQDYDALVQLLSRPISGLSPARHASALASLSRRMAIVDFMDSESYCDPPRRTATALKLFAGLAYRDGDGLKGFLADLRGRRSTRHFLSTFRPRSHLRRLSGSCG